MARSFHSSLLRGAMCDNISHLAAAASREPHADIYLINQLPGVVMHTYGLIITRKYAVVSWSTYLGRHGFLNKKKTGKKV